MMKRINKWATLLIIGLVVLAGCASNTSAPNGEFIVGMECGYAPYNWTEPSKTETGVPIDGGQYCDGYDVQIAKLIAKDLGRDLVIKKMTWEGLILSAQSGQIDGIIAGMSPTDERRQEIDFSDYYYVGAFGVVVRADSPFANAKTVHDFEGMRVAQQMGTFHVELAKQLVGAEPTTPMKDFPTMTVATNTGQIDGFISDNSSGPAIEAANPELVYVPIEGPNGFVAAPELSGVSVGMKKGHPLLPEVNAALAKITKADRDTLMEAAMSGEVIAERSFIGEVWDIFDKNSASFLSGVIVTLVISITATFLGFLLGLFISIIRDYKIGNVISTVYITVFRGTPMMVQSMLIYYGIAMAIPGFKWSNIPYGNIIAGIFIVTINTGAYMAETIRSGIQALDKGQFEAAKSLGFTRWQTMTTIILPQAIRNLIPAIGNELIVNIKDTSVLNVIMVSELFFISNSIASSTYKIFQTFTITSVVYLVLTTTCALILRQIERGLHNKKTRTSYPASQTHSTQIVQVDK